jgi:ubiquinone/menaquinone biosynthesis C-methylase UbiE
VSFDRVAHLYDATRGLPDDVRDRIVDALLRALGGGPSLSILELGAGTGRIGRPLAAHGVSYTGIDISPAMLERFRAVLPAGASARLIEGDIMALPFADGSFNVVLAVHVFHLVPDWEAALDEALRVLEPGGTLVLGRDQGEPGSPAVEIRRKWRELLAARGVQLRATHWAVGAIEAALTARGAYLAEYRSAEWERTVAPLDLMMLLRDRAYSASWDVPDEILHAVHEELVAWGQEEYGDLTAPRPSRFSFDWTVSRIPAASPGA